MTDCINCKAPLTETEKFCPSCGHAVNTVNNNLSNEDFQVKMFDTVISSEDQQLEIDKEAFGSTPVIEHEKILRKKLETYRDKLLRLEQSNQSILLRRIYNKWSFDLSKLSIRGSPAEQFVIERAFQKKNAICLIPDSDDSDLADKDRTKMKSLFRTTTQLKLETGLQEAYLGFPFLAGHVAVDTYVRGPLVLFPISLEYRKLGRPSGWYLIFSREKPVIINRALMALLKKKGRIAVSNSFYERFEDLVEQISNSGVLKKDVLPSKKDGEISNSNGNQSIENYFIQNMIKILIDNGFTASLLENKLDDINVLEPLTAEQQSVLPREELHLVNYKIIGHFPQGDSAIYTDYEELMNRAESGETNQGIIDNLLEIPSPEDSWNNEGDENDVGNDINLDTIPAESLIWLNEIIDGKLV